MAARRAELFAFALIVGALALKPMIQNSASGILLLARPSFSVGDQIKTREFRGTVENIGSRSTTLRKSDDVLDDPGPAVEASGITDNAITLTISYWYPATMSGPSGVTDGAIRATMSALHAADIELSVPERTVTQPQTADSSDT